MYYAKNFIILKVTVSAKIDIQNVKLITTVRKKKKESIKQQQQKIPKKWEVYMLVYMR